MTGGTGLRMPRQEPFRPASPDASGRGRLVALFVVYLVLLAWIVLWKLEPPYVGEGELRHIKLVPFAPTAEDGASEPFEVIANLALFIPYGLYLGLLAPSWRWWNHAVVVAWSSLALEVTQHVLAVGSTDITDLIVNSAGGLTGFRFLVLARRRLRDGTGTVMMRVCSVGTVILLLAAANFIAFPVHYAPLRGADIFVGSLR
ncbi:VanZ family protein [Agromyces bauzanensis]|uniref:VanZ-like domain-containing protein n=1 Tax=Agromyces bauzanensis TaxID=1308924 RepID=A0A917UUQ4_9MICO|nr:VanZ family protein [Agromyces bauzanensis]GGJ87396.1 hypothetical protein GCM10011372_27360 [Agromyces bauzanensis]